GVYLRSLLAARLGRRCRLEVLGALQKVALLPCSTVDQSEAFAAGQHAAQAAITGESGVCVTINREPAPPSAYRACYGLAPLERIARSDRLLPPSFRQDGAPTPAFSTWLEPLLGDLREQVSGLLDEGAE
ncbi:MAG: hypothetical protein ACYDCQ_19090, partial [Dehalococcoidia bacterium]